MEMIPQEIILYQPQNRLFPAGLKIIYDCVIVPSDTIDL